LTEAQAAMWREIVATRPSEWFAADSAPVLEAYCQAVFSYRRTAQALDALDPSDSAYVPMAKLAGSQQQTIKTLATSLRLTPQSRFTPGAAATASKKVAAAKPWEIRHG
jgi:phage terminase small subunit